MTDFTTPPFSAPAAEQRPPDWLRRYRHITWEEGGRHLPRLDCHGLVLFIMAAEKAVALMDHCELTLSRAAAAGLDFSAETFTTAFIPVQQGFERAFDVAVIRRAMVVDNRARRGWWHLGVVSRPGFIFHLEQDAGPVETPFRDTSVARGSATLLAKDVRLFRHVSLVDT